MPLSTRAPSVSKEDSRSDDEGRPNRTTQRPNDAKKQTKITKMYECVPCV